MKSFFSRFSAGKTKLKIEFCQNNLDRFLDEQSMPAYEHFLAGPRIEYKEFECLSECKTCRQSPYAKVNGELITAPDALTLIEKLKQIQASEER